MNKYEIILKAYETGNITKTAESLNYTQSAVSQAINNYEKELGFAIFIRSKSGVSPTADGLRIIDSIKRIIKEEERIQEISSSVSGLHHPRGRLYQRFHPLASKVHEGIQRIVSQHSI